MKDIEGYYHADNLYQRILDGLKAVSADMSELSLEDLQPVDEFHIRGGQATRELIELAGFNEHMHIIDVGCGAGGSSRRLAASSGCHVTGVDLSASYIDTASKLTELLNLQHKLEFKTASAMQLPFADNQFDGGWSIQMNMNIADKQGWLQELFRVIKPGGKLVLYEVCAGEADDLHFPVPWAQDASMSFLVRLDEFRKSLEKAGFTISHWQDKTSLAKQAFAGMNKPAEKPLLPPLGVHLLVGEDIPFKAYNLHRNLEENKVTLIEAAAIKP